MAMLMCSPHIFPCMAPTEWHQVKCTSNNLSNFANTSVICFWHMCTHVHLDTCVQCGNCLHKVTRSTVSIIFRFEFISGHFQIINLFWGSYLNHYIHGDCLEERSTGSGVSWFRYEWVRVIRYLIKKSFICTVLDLWDTGLHGSSVTEHLDYNKFFLFWHSLQISPITTQRATSKMNPNFLWKFTITKVWLPQCF